MAGTWIFSRGEHQIELRRRDRDDGADLIVTGSLGVDIHCFGRIQQLLDFEAELEERLTLLGWSLTDYFPERRTGHERRLEPRTPERRRPAARDIVLRGLQ
jgi:hypothetical protein